MVPVISALVHPSGPRLIVQPDDGLDPVRRFIASADESLLIKQFTFTDDTLIEAVLERRLAGVDVRVMLNAARSGGDRANDETHDRFKAAGIDVQWANPKFYVTHEKSIVVDEKAALVATFNLCLKYFTMTRDYRVIISDPEHVAQIVEVFDADWNHAAGGRRRGCDRLLRHRLTRFVESHRCSAPVRLHEPLKGLR
jgi:phosphatidylserine/phosphatidylglycerophosphate/cardiolipin synthase-like enzyme